MERCYFWEFILFICWNEENFDMVMWIFQMKLERCKNLKVFFCGTVPLFAHFILCYRGISLTVFDYFVCLGLLVKVLLCCSWKWCQWKVILGLWCCSRFPAVPERYTVSVLGGWPEPFPVRDQVYPNLNRCSSPFLSFLFYSLLILLLYLLLQTRPNQTYQTRPNQTQYRAYPILF